MMGAEVDVAALRKVAGAATPGPWSAADEHGLLGPDATPAWCISRMRPGYEAMSPTEGYRYDIAEIVHDDEHTQADAEHIATFDPPTVLELLDRLEAVEAKVARVEDAVNERVTLALPVGRMLAEGDRDNPERPYALINPDALVALMDEATAIRAALEGP